MDKAKPQDIGFMKLTFFKGLVLYKPAISILVFDWQNEDSGVEWKQYETTVLNQVKLHQDKCAGARQSKIIFLIFLPLHD